MRMLVKSILLIVILIFTASSSYAESVRLYGSLKGMNTTKSKIVQTGISSEVFNDKIIEIEGDAEGNFNVTANISEPGYYSLGRNVIYIKPGDVIELYPSSSAANTVFKGSGSEFNDYLKGCGWQEGRQVINIGEQRTFTQIVHVADSIGKLRQRDLDRLTITDKNVYDTEIARINAEKISLYFNYFIYSLQIQKGDSDSSKASKKHNYYKSIEGVVTPLMQNITASGDYLEVPVVRSIIFESLDYGYFKIEKSAALTELIATKKYSTKVDLGITKENFKELSDYANIIKNNMLKSSYKNKLEARSKFMEGTPASDFEIKDITGKSHKLSEHKGEVLFIDFWATWCMPCLGQSPYFKVLSEKYTTIRFLSISVDQDPEKWKKKIGAETEKTIANYIADVYQLQKSWDLQTIPRFILIDKEFNIITAFAPRPSDKQAIEALLDKYK